MVGEVKKRRRGYTRVSSKNQVTIPAQALAASGLRKGDELHVASEGPGRLVLTRAADPLDEFAGSLPYPSGYLRGLRDEWERPGRRARAPRRAR